ncbi:MAG: DUF3841 domain-containing protein [Bacilli bacterium]|nr:DUF3841 domain-containing protein [Bacilli bacterium]
MKLVTFQSLEATKDLFKKGYLECNESYINFKKVGDTYKWITEKMNKSVKNEFNSSYPLWCWVKCYNYIIPPKIKGEKVKDFDVKITFNKNEKDVFITDFRRYSFLLNNIYIPDNLEDKISFDKKLDKYNITKEDLEAYVRHDKYLAHRTDNEFLNICSEIRNSFDKCITKDSNILQGCVWRINLDEIESIEFLKDDGYKYGTLNYVRSNGKRIDWTKEYYKMLRKDNNRL